MGPMSPEHIAAVGMSFLLFLHDPAGSCHGVLQEIFYCLDGESSQYLLLAWTGMKPVLTTRLDTDARSEITHGVLRPLSLHSLMNGSFSPPLFRLPGFPSRSSSAVDEPVLSLATLAVLSFLDLLQMILCNWATMRLSSSTSTIPPAPTHRRLRDALPRIPHRQHCADANAPWRSRRTCLYAKPPFHPTAPSMAIPRFSSCASLLGADTHPNYVFTPWRSRLAGLHLIPTGPPPSMRVFVSLICIITCIYHPRRRHLHPLPLLCISILPLAHYMLYPPPRRNHPTDYSAVSSSSSIFLVSLALLSHLSLGFRFFLARFRTSYSGDRPVLFVLFLLALLGPRASLSYSAMLLGLLWRRTFSSIKLSFTSSHANASSSMPMLPISFSRAFLTATIRIYRTRPANQAFLCAMLDRMSNHESLSMPKL
ncbi:hypothetical protein K438DRAFT_2003832 [Mycena galopus ATCC 62051]|nr:hypothetical protein K438DRAFT_2003832 [Mycena galopus ATCC 62051]